MARNGKVRDLEFQDVLEFVLKAKRRRSFVHRSFYEEEERSTLQAGILVGEAKAFVRDLAIQILALLVAGYFGILFSVNVSAILGIQKVLWENLLAAVLVVAGIAVLARRYMIMRRVQGAAGLGFISVPRRPEQITRQFTATYYGVRWRVLYGSYMPGDTPLRFR